MKQESGCYRDLLNLSRDQKKILISGKLEGLQENVQQQEKIMFSLGPLSEVRQKSLEGLGKSLGFKKPTVAEVAGRLPEDQSASLRLAANELLDTVRDLDAVNSTNGQLLENAQAYAKFTLEAIQGTATIRPGDPGHVQVEKGHVASSFNQTA
jgi:flagellar biosynthesis/type III secretory pathway chaperone